MKKISFLSIMMLVLMAMPLFVSCGSDDDNDDGARAHGCVLRVLIPNKVVMN